MVFNGLTGSDLIVYNALCIQDLPKRVEISYLSRLTGYHYNTIKLVLIRLEQWQIIKRWRERKGQPYTYEVIDFYDFPHS